jgi:uncharacterized membrane protein
MTTVPATHIESPDRKPFFQTWEAIALAALIAVHFFLLTYKLDLYSFYVDEAGYWRKVSKSVGGMLAALAQDNIPPLYFFLLKGWYQVFGKSEVALRSLSVLFGLANIAVLFIFIRAFWTRGLAFLVTVLFAVSPLNVFCARLVKYFSFFTFLALLVHYFFFRLLENGKQKSYAIGYSVAAICLIYAHYFGFVVLVVLGFVRFVSKRRTKVSAKRWLLMHAIIVLAYVPWLVPFIGRLGETGSVSAGALPSAGSFLRALAIRIGYALYAFCFGHTLGPWHVILIVVAGSTFGFLVARGIIKILRNPADDFSREIVLIFVAILFLAALVLSFFLPSLHFVFFSERVVFLVPLFLFIVAQGMSGLRRAAAVLLAIIVLTNAFSLFNLLTARENTIWSYLIPWKDIRTAIQQPVSQKQIILFDNYHLGSTGLYYLSESGDLREIWDEQHEHVAVDMDTDVAGYQRVIFIRSARDVTEAKTLARIEMILKNRFLDMEEKDFVRENEAFYKLKLTLRGDNSPTFEYKVRVMMFSAPRAL